MHFRLRLYLSLYLASAVSVIASKLYSFYAHPHVNYSGSILGVLGNILWFDILLVPVACVLTYISSGLLFVLLGVGFTYVVLVTRVLHWQYTWLHKAVMFTAGLAVLFLSGVVSQLQDDIGYGYYDIVNQVYVTRPIFAMVYGSLTLILVTHLSVLCGSQLATMKHNRQREQPPQKSRKRSA